MGVAVETYKLILVHELSISDDLGENTQYIPLEDPLIYRYSRFLDENNISSGIIINQIFDQAKREALKIDGNYEVKK